MSYWRSYMWHADGRVRSVVGEQYEVSGVAMTIDDIAPLLDGSEAGRVE